MQDPLAGFSPINVALGLFFFWLNFPTPLGFALGDALLVVWTQTAARLGDFWGDAGPPSPGLFVPQPLEATEALWSHPIYSHGTFGHISTQKAKTRGERGDV